MSKPSKIVCRFAPSPTGPLHVGGVRSALFNYLFAKQNNGKLVLRVEDTDKERSKQEYADDIVEGFKWLGLSFDETVIQSERIENHKKYLSILIEKGLAYVSKEKVTEEGQRAEVIRFKNPNRKIAFDDLIKGHIEFDTTELGDFVIAKSLSEPLFHLAVVADDFDMGITHVIRGEDHISNTPRQILIQEAIGAPRPLYAHIPLILATDKSKLSKRKHGESVSLKFYREQGYLPEALINFLALLGWNPGSDRELFSLKELVTEFKLDRVQKGGAIFNPEKLNWVNKEYLHLRPKGEVVETVTQILHEEPLTKYLADWQQVRLATILADRIQVFSEIKKILIEEGIEYLSHAPTCNPTELLWKKSPDPQNTKTHLLHVVKLLEELEPTASMEEVQSAILPYAEKEGKGEILWPMRFALSGKQKSIDPFNLASLLGITESISRLKTAANLLQ
ncbi:MAG: glutamate--tRNA ligase [Candidatus Taylorbacteria bacterium RIFCSPHIGHO2_01_FULL_46_22b]|uniref:Glutamate--tRNA ligase n=1 Tax=Candidatus Taylorbacteria bacterium RIFCSPHIGHO2_01_FULL_46_22b TaxID=1802301 RepID=A0A1G2M161_9BACT|nr:MAG: glutamate--tRNA ligase [Candidatus Taylorbacteria bacterium RIFCSPHIGHO2_01_FULL_46_22b]